MLYIVANTNGIIVVAFCLFHAFLRIYVFISVIHLHIYFSDCLDTGHPYENERVIMV